MPSPINFPPEEVIKPIFGKKDFELIILWMLNNNEVCTWSNLKKLVKPSTLSIYLKNLQKKKLIVKMEFNQYTITSKGKDRYYEFGLKEEEFIQHVGIFGNTIDDIEAAVFEKQRIAYIPGRVIVLHQRGAGGYIITGNG